MSIAVPATELLRGDHRQIEDLLDRLLLLAKHPDRNMAAAVAGYLPSCAG